MPAAKIQIVDDTRANLVALQVLLKPIEADIVTAESGEQALRAAQQDEDRIAEGVETAEQWEYLHGLSCDFVQGYYFGKPMPKAEFEEYLTAQLAKPVVAQS